MRLSGRGQECSARDAGQCADPSACASTRNTSNNRSETRSAGHLFGQSSCPRRRIFVLRKTGNYWIGLAVNGNGNSPSVGSSRCP
jgi:hypothetical protein